MCKKELELTEIEKSVDEGHVDRDEQDDGLSEEDAHGPADVLDNHFLEVNLNFFLLSVDAPILSSSTQLSGFVDQYNRRVCFLKEEQQEPESQETHKRTDVHGPPPAKV